MTHTAKHTPGPWVVDDDYEDEEQQAIGIVKDGHGYIAGIHILASCINGEGFSAEDRANAHLIAAAPAMYEALREIVAAVGSGEVIDYSSAGDWYTEACAVLAQAEGKQ